LPGPVAAAGLIVDLDATAGPLAICAAPHAHALHMPDGAGIAARNERLAAFPKTFGWIHVFDALEAARAAHPVRRSASK
jgi:hypothetical protein